MTSETHARTEGELPLAARPKNLRKFMHWFVGTLYRLVVISINCWFATLTFLDDAPTPTS